MRDGHWLGAGRLADQLLHLAHRLIDTALDLLIDQAALLITDDDTGCASLTRMSVCYLT